MEAFLSEVLMAYSNWHFIILSMVLIIVGLAFLKGYKKRFVIPALIITVTILNPIFYKLWYKFNDRSYWRMMWMIPIIPICTIVPSFFIDKYKNRIIRITTLLLTIVIFSFCGSCIFIGSSNTFDISSNPEKLPDIVVKIGEKLLELDNHPTVVADGQISTYLRQYSGKFIVPYARSATWGSPKGISGEIYSNLINENMLNLSKSMLNLNYNYLVTDNTNVEKQAKIEDAGFQIVGQVDKYGIYKATGEKTLLMTYNANHQSTSVTTIDESGNPVNGESGYATVYYGYDDFGRKNYEYRVDNIGNAVLDKYGRSGYRSEIDFWGTTVKQTYLGIDGDPIAHGLSNGILEYKGELLIKESFYDSDGKPINIGEIGYASYFNEYTSEGLLSLTSYYDSDGNYIEGGSSYFHKYLLSLKEREALIFISAKDEASYSLTSTLVDDMKELGLTTDLRGHYRESYIAVISSDKVIEEVRNDAIHIEGSIGELSYIVSSAGNNVGNHSSIIINGREYSKNTRGLNIVIVEKGEITETIAFDTNHREMKVTR